MDSLQAKEAYFDNLFTSLQNSIGKEVSCIYWKFGELAGFRGILKEVAPFDYINIEGTIINFVGQRTAIQYILLQEKDVVYSVYKNPAVEHYHGSFTDPMVVIDAQKQFLGRSIAEEEMEDRFNKYGR